MFRTFKGYLYMACGIAIIAGLAYTHIFVYKAGINSADESNLKAIKQYQASIIDLWDELEAEKKNVRIEYRDKVIAIKQAQDATGCADTDAPDSILQQYGYNPSKP